MNRRPRSRPGAEGYADLFHIAAAARAHLKPGGLLLLEHGSIRPGCCSRSSFHWAMQTLPATRTSWPRPRYRGNLALKRNKR